MNVIWLQNAEQSYSNELENILNKWTVTEVVNFIDLVDDFIKKLESGILQGRVFAKKTMRSFVISKQTTVYFDVFEDIQTIELLLFWNNKDNPKKLKNLLR